MTDAQLDRAIERYYDRMLEDMAKREERNCGKCRYYYNGMCDLVEEPDDDPDRDEDDFCEAFEAREDDYYPDWMEDE